jgi:hypothetical protein
MTAVLASALLVAAGAVGMAQAGRQVLFRDYRTLLAQSVEEDGEELVLDMGQGNQVRVPADAVLEVREYTPPPPAPEPAGPGARKAARPDFGPPLPTWRDRAGQLAATIEKTALESGLDPELLAAVALTESRFDALALSRAGAQGVMQLMPGTARLLKVGDVWDPHQNVAAGARWLKRLLDKFDGNLDLALAAYNAGEEAVKRFGGIPPYRETQLYVERVRALAQGFSQAS